MLSMLLVRQCRDEEKVIEMRSHFLADACGIIGVFGTGDIAGELGGGLYALQHRGQMYSGAGVSAAEGIRVFSHKGPVEEWDASRGDYLIGEIGIGHVGSREPQPIKHRSGFGEMAVCFSGYLLNASEILADMLADGRSFADGGQAEVISKVIGSSPDVTHGMERVYSLLSGAFSLLVMTRSALYAARDPRGIRPLVLGWRQAGWAVAAESRALTLLDFQVKRDLEPGEIIRIDSDGVETCKRVDVPRRAHCAFEWAYISGHDSVIEKVWVRDARRRMGETLAVVDREAGFEADVVAPVPRSGIGCALGYHQAAGLPYDEVFLDLRDFKRGGRVKNAGKPVFSNPLSVIWPAVSGRRIVLCDDSLVRGRGIKKRIGELRGAGAREVHVRIACPPLLFSCDYGGASGITGELMARQLVSGLPSENPEMVEKLGVEMGRLVGADSLRFNTLEKFVEAIGLKHSDLCLKCFDGKGLETPHPKFSPA